MNSDKSLIYKGGAGAPNAGTCRCLLTPKNNHISLRLRAADVRLGAKRSHECTGTVLSWGQGSYTDGALDCLSPNKPVRSILYNSSTTMWVELRIEQQRPAMVLLDMYPGM